MARIANLIRCFVTYNTCGFMLLTALPGCAAVNQPPPSTQQQHAKIQKLNTRINSVLASSKSKAEVGIIIQSMSTGAVVYQKNANQLLLPASNLKIFTAYAALQQLGPEFKYHTQLLTDATTISNGVIDGNLYVKFDGDPELEVKDLNMMIASLSRQGIHTVTGNFYVDANHYDDQGTAPGTLASDTRYCYGAPIGAVILNHNCASLRVLPGRKVGQQAQLSSLLNVPLPIHNNVITKAVTKNCPLRLTESDDNKYYLNGCVKPKSRAAGLSFAVRDSKAYGEEIMRSLLAQHQIKVAGMAERNPANLPLKVLVSYESRPLKDLVYDMLKKSDNIIANSLFKNVGADYFKQSGTWENSSQAMHAILAKNTISNPVNGVIIDGSGLSMNNRVTATQILQVLNNAYHDPMLAANFIPALPVSGINGTLKHRMRDVHMAGKVKAKTGSMKNEGVSSLSGYVETINHEIYAFSIIVNSRGHWLGQYRILEDKICRVLSTV